MTVDAAEDIPRAAGYAEPPGKLLSDARQAQNLSVADVARQLKLSVRQVEALEAGEFQQLPGAVFVRGFVRNYARLLRLDAESLLRSVAECLPREEPRPAAPPSQDIPFPTAAPRRWPLFAALTVATLAALGTYEFFQGEPQSIPVRSAAPSSPAAPSPLPGAAPLAQPVASAPGEAGQAVDSPAQPGVPGQDNAAAATPAGPAPAGADAVPAGGGAAREQEAAPGPGERQVRMVFDQRSWVEIRDGSGRLIFSQLNDAGTEQRVYGRPPLSVVVGNARGVRLTYGERAVDLMPHTKVDVARLTLE
jgi:cytoskeleton protein RodZ